MFPLQGLCSQTDLNQTTHRTHKQLDSRSEFPLQRFGNDNVCYRKAETNKSVN